MCNVLETVTKYKIIDKIKDIMMEKEHPGQ